MRVCWRHVMIHVCSYMLSYLKSVYTDTLLCMSYATKTIKSLYKFKLRMNKFVCEFLIVGIYTLA